METEPQNQDLDEAEPQALSPDEVEQIARRISQLAATLTDLRARAEVIAVAVDDEPRPARWHRADRSHCANSPASRPGAA